MTFEQITKKIVKSYTQSRQSTAERLHTDLAQPLLAARLFTRSILDEIEQKADYQQMRETAHTIESMITEAFEVTYDLMRESEIISPEPLSFSDSLSLFTEKLKYQTCTITFDQKCLDAFESSPTSLEQTLVQLVLDAVLKRILVYLKRNHPETPLSLHLGLAEHTLEAELLLDCELEPGLIDDLCVIQSARHELKIVDGSLTISNLDTDTLFKVRIPWSEASSRQAELT